MTLYQNHIGIDVSKDHLDLYSIARDKGWRIGCGSGMENLSH